MFEKLTLEDKRNFNEYFNWTPIDEFSNECSGFYDYRSALINHGIIDQKEASELERMKNYKECFEWLDLDDKYRNTINKLINEQVKQTKDNETKIIVYNNNKKTWFLGYLVALDDAEILTAEECEKLMKKFDKGETI